MAVTGRHKKKHLKKMRNSKKLKHFTEVTGTDVGNIEHSSTDERNHEKSLSEANKAPKCETQALAHTRTHTHRGKSHKIHQQNHATSSTSLRS